MSPERTWAAIGDEKFVSLTTFRRSGEPVSTPVWIGRDGDSLVVTTPAGTGKVKRLRGDPRVELRPCSRRGRVDEAAPTTAGVAQIRDDLATTIRAHRLLSSKYGLQFRLVMGVERLIRRGAPQRQILQITPMTGEGVLGPER